MVCKTIVAQRAPIRRKAHNLRIGLFAFPIAEPFQPCLSLPYLAAQMHLLGFNVTQHDLTGLFYFWLVRQLKWQSALRYEDLTEAATALRDEHSFFQKSIYDKSLARLKDYFADVAAQDGLPYTLFPAASGASVAHPKELLELVGRMPGTRIDRFLVDYVAFTLRLEAYDVMGFSATNQFQLAASLFIIDKLKRAGVRAHVVLGGHAPSISGPGIISEGTGFLSPDSIVLSGGARAFSQACEDLVAGRVKEVYGRWPPKENYYEEPAFGFSTTIPCNIVLPRDVLEFYLSPKLIFSVYSASGCSYGQCVFCNSNQRIKAYVPRPVNVIIAEIENLVHRWGASHFIVCDNNFAPDRIRDFCDGLNIRGLKVAWQCTSRVSQGLDSDLLCRMRTSGCVLLSVGLESASDRVLTLMRKGYTIQDVKRLITDMKRVGLPAHLYCICGFPGETEDDSKRTAEFLATHADDYHSVYFQDYCKELVDVVIKPSDDLSTSGWKAEDMINWLKENGSLNDRFDFLENLLRRHGYPAVEEHNFLYLSRELKNQNKRRC